MLALASEAGAHVGSPLTVFFVDENPSKPAVAPRRLLDLAGRGVHPTFFGAVEPIFHAVDAGTVRATTSVLTLLEVLVKPLQRAVTSDQR